jgi:hypothetical protein
MEKCAFSDTLVTNCQIDFGEKCNRQHPADIDQFLLLEEAMVTQGYVDI